jgi:cellulose biosynthesis protein BcsQ
VSPFASRPVLTLFNNKGGVGKTSLVYHLAWMLAEMGIRVLACDLDPQANLTAAFLDEDRLEELWIEGKPEVPSTIYRCIQPLTEVGDLRAPELQLVATRLALLPGDLALSGFEDRLSSEWPESLGSSNLYRPFRILSAFWQVAQLGAKQHAADLIIVDVGPNLGAINRSALIASDAVLVPLGADLFSLQGLRNLGPTLRRWRGDWTKRLENWQDPQFEVPSGRMQPMGYLVQQHGVRLSRPVKAYDRWVNRIPSVYRTSVLDEPAPPSSLRTADDENCLATLKHYRSLVPMGQEARKPIFHLTVADGAIGNHALAVKEAYSDFEKLATKVLSHIAREED